jgi:hypothetical protein
MQELHPQKQQFKRLQKYLRFNAKQIDLLSISKGYANEQMVIKELELEILNPKSR